MEDIIEALNNTSARRTFFYVAAFIISLAIVVDGIVEVVKRFK